MKSMALRWLVGSFACSSACVGFSARASAQRQLDPDLVFDVARGVAQGYQSLRAPSANDANDLVAHFAGATQKEIRVLFDADQRASLNDGSTPSVLVRASSAILGAFPVINDYASVATENFFNGFGVVQRFDLTGPMTYVGTTIARSDPNQTFPFVFLSPIVALDGTAVQSAAYFYGERQPFVGPYDRSIYRSTTEVTAPGVATKIASTSSGYSTLDLYIAAAANGSTAYRGTRPAGLGIYTGSFATPVATTGTGFVTTGSRPGVNSLGTVAFVGSTQSQAETVWLRYATGDLRLAGSVASSATAMPFGDLPASHLAFERPGINDFNQVAYKATNSDGKTAIFATNLGATRQIAAVDDVLTFGAYTSSITSLAVFDSLKRRGQPSFLATTADGENHILRVNRGYSQTKLNDSPIAPTYAGVDYLLRSVAGSGFPPGKTLGQFGCNLTSVANVLSFFGVEQGASPGALQNWLLAKYATAQNKATYISSATNDFNERFVTEFTSELVASGHASRVAHFVGIHRNATVGNLTKTIQELRAHRPVKLRVASGAPPLTAATYKPYGHYVIAYGLVDPTKADAQLGMNDVLIHDPGHGGRYTLGDYGQAGYDAYAPGWFEDDQRVYLYDATPALAPSTDWLDVRAYSSMEIVVTDPLGRRLGFDPAIGAFNEIPGGSYVDEPAYAELDAEPAPLASVWGAVAAVQRASIETPLLGSYTVELIATADGPYEVDVSTSESTTVDHPRLAGTLSAGQRVSYPVHASTAPTIHVSGSSSAGGLLALDLSSPDDPGATYVVGVAFGASPGIPVNQLGFGPSAPDDTRVLPLNDDTLHKRAMNRPGVFQKFVGVLDSTGRATASIQLPSSSAYAGTTFHVAFLTLDAQALSGVSVVSDATAITIGP